MLDKTNKKTKGFYSLSNIYLTIGGEQIINR